MIADVMITIAFAIVFANAFLYSSAGLILGAATFYAIKYGFHYSIPARIRWLYVWIIVGCGAYFVVAVMSLLTHHPLPLPQLPHWLPGWNPLPKDF